jgi:hypothetical protein
MIGILDNATQLAGALPFDNRSSIHVFNLTVPGTPVQVGSAIPRDDNASRADLDSQFCGAVGGGRVLVFTDNQSNSGAANATSAAYGGARLYATGIDNATGWDFNQSFGSTGIFDNSTAEINCAMTYGGITGVTRTFYMVVDNNSDAAATQEGFVLYTITDNTTVSGTGSLGATLTVSVSTINREPRVESLAIDVDSNGVVYTVIDNSSGAYLYTGSTTMVELGAAIGVFGPVDVKVSSDDKKVGVAGFATQSTNTYPAVRIWYNE